MTGVTGWTPDSARGIVIPHLHQEGPIPQHPNSKQLPMPSIRADHFHVLKELNPNPDTVDTGSDGSFVYRADFNNDTNDISFGVFVGISPPILVNAEVWVTTPRTNSHTLVLGVLDLHLDADMFINHVPCESILLSEFMS